MIESDNVTYINLPTYVMGYLHMSESDNVIYINLPTYLMGYLR
jgi:hypothetical protein